MRLRGAPPSCDGRAVQQPPLRFDYLEPLGPRRVTGQVAQNLLRPSSKGRLGGMGDGTMYGAALPAGHYLGGLGRYHGRRASSRDGAGLRECAKRTALGAVGLRGLGGLGQPTATQDMCNSEAGLWARNIAELGSSLVSVAASTQQNDQGWQAAAGTTGAITNTWNNICTQANRQQAGAGGVSAAQFQQWMQQQQAQAQAAIAANSASGGVDLTQLASILAANRPQPQSSSGIDTNTILIGAGVLGAVVLAAVLLR